MKPGLARSYARELRRIASALPSRDGALDIGAGDGAFLEQLLANGFSSVVGLEPSTAPIDQARPELRALLREGFFEGGDFQDASLSLITCCQTLEHTDDPLGLCNSAFRILKPGGALFTIAHDSRALSAKLLGARSPIYDIEHLQLHSRRSLHFMLEHAGFERIDVHLASGVLAAPPPRRESSSTAASEDASAGGGGGASVCEVSVGGGGENGGGSANCATMVSESTCVVAPVAFEADA